MVKVGSSTSTKTGRAPEKRIVLALAMKVNETVSTSSPGPMPLARRARCSAVVPELVATACGTPMNAAKRSSRARTLAPWASDPELSTSQTSSFSSSPIWGRAMGITWPPPAGHLPPGHWPL